MYGKFKQQLKEKLSNIKEEGLYKDERVIMNPQGALIKVSNEEDVLNFCANNYLGLANNPEIIKAAKNGIKKWGFGLSSVRFICGTQSIHKRLEEQIAKFLKTEDTPNFLKISCAFLSPCIEFTASQFSFIVQLSDKDAISNQNAAADQSASTVISLATYF